MNVLTYVKSGIIKMRGKVYAYDLNDPLISVYKNIQTQHNELYEKLQDIIREFNDCGGVTNLSLGGYQLHIFYVNEFSHSFYVF